MPIVAALQKLVTPAMKEVDADAAYGGARVNRSPQRVSKTGVNRGTPGNVCYSVSVRHAPSLFQIGIDTTYPPCGIRRSQKVAKKWQSMSPGLGGNTQKLDAVIDRN